VKSVLLLCHENLGDLISCVHLPSFIRPPKCLTTLLLFPCVPHFIAVFSIYHYISVVSMFASLQCCSEYISHYIAVLSMSASLHCCSLRVCLITFLLSICLITLKFSIYVPHHVVLVSIYALLQCSSLHMCIITLSLSPHMPHDIAFLSIYTSSLRRWWMLNVQ
jgi:hypothetical protein